MMYPEVSVQVRVDPFAGCVHVNLKLSDRKYLLSISDNGHGISEELQTSLGQRPITFGKGIDGNGLGFYHAKKWAIKIGGNLSIQSDIGKGTVVLLEIPRS